MYELKIYRGAMCHHNEEWWKVWSGIDFSFQNWHEKFEEVWPEHSKFQKFAFNGLLLNKVYNVCTKTVHRSYVSWHWKVMQNLKKNWLVVWKMIWA